MPVLVQPDPASWAGAGAELVVAAARRAVEERGRFSLVLAGGQTPSPVYELLARAPFREQMPWACTHLFWGDERCVHPDDPRSNFGRCRPWLARLACRGLSAGQVHRLAGEAAPPARAAHLYELELRAFFAGETPAFDLVLLGLGADGHLASLFPGQPALAERQAWVVATEPPAGVEPAVERLTLTLPVINAARQVVFLVAGAAKAQIVGRVLRSQDADAQELPASLVRPAGGEPLWLLDQAAAGGPAGR